MWNMNIILLYNISSTAAPAAHIPTCKVELGATAKRQRGTEAKAVAVLKCCGIYQKSD